VTNKLTSGGRAVRLEALKALLAERDYTTAAELAAELSVSVRTLHRDLALLRDLGIPVDTDRDRGWWTAPRARLVTWSGPPQ
jgi:predicted DNA-binding transcriptional regulator YafY